MQYVLITGVSSGIGNHLLKDLHQKGYFVFGSVRKEADAARLRSEYESRFQPLVFDVTDGEAIALAVPKVAETLNGQPLTALINNAGIAVSGPLQYIPMEKVRLQFDVNVIGVVQVTQAFLPMLGAVENFQGSPGRIINISSISGLLTAPYTALYSASKFALESLTDGYRRELKDFGIEAISIQPGPIKTPIWGKVESLQGDYSKTPYASVFNKIDKYLHEVEAGALPPAEVAKAVHKALMQPKPKTRYTVAKAGGIIRLISNIFPARWVDNITISNLKKRLS
ncbi:MAG: SDR family oxidoreductase [Bacteroidota bacterium]